MKEDERRRRTTVEYKLTKGRQRRYEMKNTSQGKNERKRKN